MSPEPSLPLGSCNRAMRNSVEAVQPLAGGGVAIVIPALNEVAALPALAEKLRQLDPPAAEIILVDGGSTDGTADLARGFGFRVVEADPGRANQINRGVAAVSSPLVCVLHADTLLPKDAIALIARTLSDRRVALASFLPLFRGRKTRWVSTLHGWLKTWYAPLLFRPHLFARGARLLFGDHAMFFRRGDFLDVGGCDPDLGIMEDAALCIAMSRLGRVRLVHRFVVTSDRRMAEWGELRTNWVALRIGVGWALGRTDGLERLYPPVR